VPQYFANASKKVNNNLKRDLEETEWVVDENFMH
jgi:hypothetical protein